MTCCDGFGLVDLSFEELFVVNHKLCFGILQLMQTRKEGPRVVVGVMLEDALHRSTEVALSYNCNLCIIGYPREEHVDGIIGVS